MSGKDDATDAALQMAERSKQDGAKQKKKATRKGSSSAGSKGSGFTFEKLDAISWPPLEWWLKGLLPKQGVGQVYGFSGSGKSFLCLDLAVALALGRDWFLWRFTGRGKEKLPLVLYLCLEGASGFKLRADAVLCREKKKNPAFTVPDNLLVSCDDFDFSNDDRVNELVDYISGNTNGRSPIIFIDTQGKALPSHDINDAETMTKVMRRVQSLAEQINGFVLLVTHIGKTQDASKGAVGSYVQRAESDLQISVEKKAKSHSFTINKVKDDADGQRVEFMLHSWPLGLDADGLPDSSCTVEPVDASPVMKLTEKQADALRWLKAAYTKAGKKAGETISMDAWRTACADELGIKKTDKRVHNAITNQKDALQDKDIIVCSSTSTDVILLEGF